MLKVVVCWVGTPAGALVAAISSSPVVTERRPRHRAYGKPVTMTVGRGIIQLNAYSALVVLCLVSRLRFAG